MERGKCKNCCYFETKGKAASYLPEGGGGECRRAIPLCSHNVHLNKLETTYAIWPVVSERYWCGEWTSET